MKQMKTVKGYADGGMVEDSPKDERAEGEVMPSNSMHELRRQVVGAPNQCEYNQGPGVRSIQDYRK